MLSFKTFFPNIYLSLYFLPLLGLIWDDTSRDSLSSSHPQVDADVYDFFFHSEHKLRKEIHLCESI